MNKKYKISALIYRLTGIINPFIYKEILYSYMEKMHKQDNYDLDIYTGMWQAKHGFYRPIKGWKNEKK